MDIDLSPRNTLLLLLSVIGLLVLANVAGIVSTYAFDHDYVFGLVPLFDLNTERNIPTLYSSLQLTLAGLLLLLIGYKHRTNDEPYLPWIILAAIFLFLAIDETAGIHERFSKPMNELLDPSGLLYFSWVIPYGIAVLLLLALFARFLLRLPTQLKALFFASGAVYICGAIGFEMLGARLYEVHGRKNLIYAMYYSCEETLEMLGVALFIFALLKYACVAFDGMNIRVQD